MKQKGFAALTAFVLFAASLIAWLPAGIGHAAAVPDWETIYKRTLADADYFWTSEAYIALADLNLDGVPELVVGESYRTVEGIADIYTIEDGKAVPMKVYLNGKQETIGGNIAETYRVEMSTFLPIYGDGLLLYKHKQTGQPLYIGRGSSSGISGYYLSMYTITMRGKSVFFDSFAGMSQTDEWEDGASRTKTSYSWEGEKVSEQRYNQLLADLLRDYEKVELQTFSLQADLRRPPIDKPYEFVFPDAFRTRLEPSRWAVDEVNAAVNLGLVPRDLQRGYQQPITREEFSRLAIQFLAAHVQAPREQLPAVLSGRTEVSEPFADTSAPDVLLAYQLGIVQGKGNGIFDPDGAITRQEAAVMLARVAKLAGKQSGGAGMTFKDQAKIADWAKDSVNLITAIKEKQGTAAVMGSAGNDSFLPLGTFSKEQAFITFKRLFNS